MILYSHVELPELEELDDEAALLLFEAYGFWVYLCGDDEELLLEPLLESEEELDDPLLELEDELLAFY